mmetsp:Transcript_20063/g.63072  ORF Transcript_20063/g.63072 Transcript_20063/m.63072 type:complete len:239 (+) Transcript_20063:48-764(+)
MGCRSELVPFFGLLLLLAPATALVIAPSSTPTRVLVPSRIPLWGGDSAVLGSTMMSPLELGAPGDSSQGPSEFELNLGRAIDALRADFPEFMDRELEWGIYADDVEVRDPSGVQVQGLNAYKQTFAVVRLFRRIMIDEASVTFRLRYDWGRRRIIVHWYTKWTARGVRTLPGHVDGVSHFYLNDDGKIVRHEIDKLLVNSDPLNPPVTGWLAFRQYVLARLADDRRCPAPCCFNLERH